MRTRNPFRLTPNEERVLALVRQGLDYAAIGKELGWGGMSHPGHLVAGAVEKDRLRILAAQEHQPGGVQSLAKARGRVRMEGTL